MFLLLCVIFVVVVVVVVDGGGGWQWFEAGSGWRTSGLALWLGYALGLEPGLGLGRHSARVWQEGGLAVVLAVVWRRKVVWRWYRAHLVHVRVEEAVAEADRGRLVRVAVGQLHVHAPASPVVGACSVEGCNYDGGSWQSRAGKRAVRAHCLWARGRRRRCRSGYRPPGPPYSRTSSWRESRGASIRGAKGAEGLAGL